MRTQPGCHEFISMISRTTRIAKLMPALIIITMAGCTGGNLIEVTRSKPLPSPPEATACAADDSKCGLPGVPFYVVAYRCTHASSWLRPLYVVTVVVSTADDQARVVAAATKVFDLKTFTTDRQVRDQLLTVQKDLKVPENKYKKDFDDFTRLPDPDIGSFKQENLPKSPEGGNAILASNQVVAERYVATDAVYFYNVKRPKSGSANAEIDLTDEGIINKGSAQAEDKMLATILGTVGTLGAAALGIPSAAAGVGSAAVAAKTLAVDGGVSYNFDVQIQTKIYRYIHSAPEPGMSPPCSPDSTLVGTRGEPFNSTFEEITAASTASDKSAEKKPQKKP